MIHVNPFTLRLFYDAVIFCMIKFGPSEQTVSLEAGTGGIEILSSCAGVVSGKAKLMWLESGKGCEGQQERILEVYQQQKKD